jgi:hypothetical protein
MKGFRSVNVKVDYLVDLTVSRGVVEMVDKMGTAMAGESEWMKAFVSVDGSVLWLESALAALTVGVLAESRDY